MTPRSLPHCALRAIGLILLLLAGGLACLLVVPLVPVGGRLRLRRLWSAWLVGVLGVRLQADLDRMPGGALLVANHISWLDIFVINAILPSTFVAKAEVAGWPLIGWLAARNDTIFLRRGSRGHARIIHAEIDGQLARGQPVVVFPEGTTSDGQRILQFHAALIQPALQAGRPVVPLAISYWTPGGERSLAARYDGEISLLASIATLLRCPALIARLVACAPCATAGEDRRRVARQARVAIAAAAGLPLPNN